MSEVDPASADAIVVVGLLRRLARPTAFLEVLQDCSSTSKVRQYLLWQPGSRTAGSWEHCCQVLLSIHRR